MTREVMDLQLGRLVMLRGMPGDTDDYFAALQDVDDVVFAAACDHALKTRTWFPVPAELRADCDAVRHAVRRLESDDEPQYRELHKPVVFEWASPTDPMLKLRIPITRDWRHNCETCRDSGMASRQCSESHCGRRFQHPDHGYVEPCACVEWNPTIRRRKEAAMRYAQPPAVNA